MHHRRVVGKAEEVGERERALARLPVSFGANVAPGQDVFVIVSEVEQAPLAREITAAAYQAGARLVSVIYWDQRVKLARLRYASEDSLSAVPDWWERHISECVERRGAYIVIWGEAEPDLLAGIDPERARRDLMPFTQSRSELSRELEVNWTIVPGPTAAIAARVLGTPEVERLWDVLTPRFCGSTPRTPTRSGVSTRPCWATVPLRSTRALSMPSGSRVPARI